VHICVLIELIQHLIEHSIEKVGTVNLSVHQQVRWDRTYRKKNSNNTWGILSLSKDLALEDNIHYSIEKPRDFTWRLRIRFIQVSDEGTYQCYVLTNQDSRAADHRIITVVCMSNNNL